MKILRLRMVEGIYNTFRSVSYTENITRRMLEDRDFLDSCLEKNLAFMKSVPNSVQYWSSRKRDLFAMIRQLGKPTVFLTLSANEIRWPIFLVLLNKLSTRYPNVSDPENLTRSQRCTLVSEDPVTCCIYFQKLVDCFMKILKSSRNDNPFGKHRVIDFFTRIEFQHRGSPHAHILLWLADDPKEAVSEDMPRTVELVESICSVSANDVPDDTVYGNQVHKHTFTCQKRGEKSCRFGIPYWPMQTTCVLLPMAGSDGRRKKFQTKAKELRQSLEVRTYTGIHQFLTDNELMSQEAYLDVIRSSLSRPTILFKRNMTQLYTNTFNPWIAGVLNSNMDLQLILDEYSCASYVVEYVNKSARGMGNLHNELLKLMEQYPDRDYTGQLKALGVKFLNSVEMSAQEAAWYLLRQPMSAASREVSYVPTVWPAERQKCRKRTQQMNEEKVSSDSTDVWTTNVIQRYEERPPELDSIYLAEFVAWYATKRDCKSNEDEEPLAEGMQGSDEQVTSVRAEPIQNCGRRYTKRKQARVIRYRHYDIEDTVNYKREMVLLYLPFRNELVDVLDSNKFFDLFVSNEEVIMQRRKLFEANVDILLVMEELMALCVLDDTDKSEQQTARKEFIVQVLGENQTENIDDIDSVQTNTGISAVRKRSNVMSKQDYCEMIRCTNPKQRELILESIHRMHDSDSQALQVFFTGPAGCGKTYTLKALMETYNRFSQQHNKLRNAYVACASTGKAAVAIGGTTVHSAFRINMSRRTTGLSTEILHCYRNMFVGVKCIIIDEISMLSSAMLQKTNERLQQITGVYDQPFGGMDVFLCGDFRQLPPVRATPCYTMPANQLGGPLLWHTLQYHPLKQVVRQADKRFSTILTKLGNGEQHQSDEIEMIESRHRSAAWCSENLPDVVRLFFCNQDVDTYNRNAIIEAFQHTSTDILIGYSTDTERNECRSKLHRLSIADTDGMPYVIPLKIGYPYMITANIDVVDGLVNGAIGTLKNIERLRQIDCIDDMDYQVQASTSQYCKNDNILEQDRITLWFEFSQPSVGAEAKLKCRPHVLSKPGQLSESWVPIYQRTVNITLSKTVKCKRKQFTLVPACAITIHKSQGGTFDEIVYKYSATQPQQLVYVALSRVTAIGGLHIITEQDKPFHFLHGRRFNNSPAIRDIRSEYQRLEQHILPTITKSVRLFCDSAVSSSDIIVMNMNVQSLKSHCSDLETDSIFQCSEYLALSETCGYVMMKLCQLFRAINALLTRIIEQHEIPTPLEG